MCWFISRWKDQQFLMILDDESYLCVEPVSVNELTDGSSWKTLATTVCIYVLLKFMQGGGAGNDPLSRHAEEKAIFGPS